MPRGKDKKPRKFRSYGDPAEIRAARYARRKVRKVELREANPERAQAQREARNARIRELRKHNPEKERTREKLREKAWRSTPKGRIRILVQKAKARARALGLEFDLHRDDLYIPTHCPALGIPLSTEPGGPMDNRYSLDRSDNRRGYVKGNVQVISYRANTIKANATATELRAVANYVEALEKLHEILA